MIAHDNTLWAYFANAGPVVKTVMMLLIIASIISWTLIFQRGLLIKRARATLRVFEDKFWSGVDLTRLYNDSARSPDGSGLESMFRAGFKEFTRQRKTGADPDTTMNSVTRSMRIAQSREMEKLEHHLPMLATIGSTSPYVGLFGTVWGIMTSFHALSAGNVQQATIAMVAPGISEALIATAMGLFAAIPAVIAYNRYANDIERLYNHYSTFQEEFTNILYRLAHSAQQES